jgi:hypothetical protein
MVTVIYSQMQQDICDILTSALRSGYTEATQGLSPGLRVARDPPCLSAVVLGRWDEGGKVAAEVRF